MQANNTGFRSSDKLTAWVRYMLYAQIIVAILSMVSGYMEYELLSGLQNGVYTSEEQVIADGMASDQRQNMVGMVSLAVMVVSAILILRWIHRANYNARQLGAENMKFSPGETIVWFFIPVLSFWMPYRAMKEIWKASKNPSDWEVQKASGVLPLWWTLWLISIFLNQAAFRFYLAAEELEDYLNFNMFTRLADVLQILLALVFLAIVNSIYHFQIDQLAIAGKGPQPATESIG